MSVLERATAHFESRPVMEMEVPEWGEGGKPLVVCYQTPNSATLSKVVRESKGDLIEQAARLVALCAKGRDGERLFQPLDYKDLMIRADPGVIDRLAASILKGASIEVERAEKN